MNLPHIFSPKTDIPKLGPQSMKALNRQIVVNRKPLRSGRITSDIDMTYDVDAFLQMADLPDSTSSWRTLETQRKNLLNLPYQTLVDIALDLGPEVNKGMHDFLRFANPAHILSNTNPTAEAATLEFISLLNGYYGSFKSHLDSIWAGIFITGGMFVELVLGEGGRYPVDLAVNDPNSARFIRGNHPIRGSIWRLAQINKVGNQPTYLDDNPLVKYLGFDRTVNNPHGRPIIGPSVHSSIFLLGLVNDMRRVIANAGLSRTDYELDAEEVLRLIGANPDIAGNDAATADFINDQIDKVTNVLENLDVDSDYVHLSTVKVNHSSNPMQINMTGINTIIDTLQRNTVNGFKGISGLSNILDSTTETHIRNQLEYYVSSIQSMQDEVGDVMNQFLDTGNQVQGIQGETSFKFRRQRTADKKATAEIESIRTQTVIDKVSANIITAEEGKEEINQFRDELEVAI